MAVFALFLNPVLWGSFYTLAKQAVELTNPLMFSTSEVIATTPVALLILLMRRKHLSRQCFSRGVVLGALLYSVVILSIFALRYTTATNTAFFPALNGVLACAIAWLVLRQRISAASVVAGALSVLGAVCVFRSSGASGGHAGGDLIALASAFMYTIYLFATKQLTADERADDWCLCAVELLTLAVLATAFTTAGHAWDPTVLGRPQFVSVALYVGLGTTFIPTAIGIFFQRYVSAVDVAFLYVLEPVWGALFAYLLLSESLSALGYLGGGLIIASSIVQTQFDLRARAAAVS